MATEVPDFIREAQSVVDAARQRESETIGKVMHLLAILPELMSTTTDGRDRFERTIEGKHKVTLTMERRPDRPSYYTITGTPITLSYKPGYKPNGSRSAFDCEWHLKRASTSDLQLTAYLVGRIIEELIGSYKAKTEEQEWAVVHAFADMRRRLGCKCC